ncbi:MAG: CDP-alcohol phosphatidyltransferase family protein [Pirellulaceae bacterium]|nr:CDP-alcohol phosphatidyltransferase family protein [Pirellulaceae bacterium]
MPRSETPLPTTENQSFKDCDSSAATSIWTIPNAICIARIIGSVGLIYLAVAQQLEAFVILFVILNVSDWIDGPIARWLGQTSDFGARLDSISDAILYGVLLFGLLWLKSDEMRAEWLWWGMVIVSFSATCLGGLIKFGSLPSYHTYAAKISQCLVLVGVVLLMLDISPWPFRISALSVVLTNLEALAITWILSRPRCDVSTLWEARQIQVYGESKSLGP